MKFFRMLSVWLLALTLSWCTGLTAATVTVVPAGFGGALPANGSVVFTFSEPMDPDLTEAFFMSITTLSEIQVTSSWNTQKTVLTCTKPGGWPTGMVAWNVYGNTLADPDGEPVEADGMFTVTDGGGGTTGSGTNAITTYLVGKSHFYIQTNSAAPVPDYEFDVPYAFTASVSLASNRTATAISVTVPGGAVKNLGTWDPDFPEEWNFFEFTTNLDTLFPAGNYVFNVTSSSGSQSATVNFNIPTQPPAPHFSNFAALQAADPTKPITISWDAWSGGTAADYIQVIAGTNYTSADYMEPGALNGTHTSVTIPANTLTPNAEHSTAVVFYRLTSVTNTTEAREAFRYSYTSMTLKTTGGVTPGGPLSFSNPSWEGTSFGFDVSCTPGQTVTIETSTTLAPGSWTTFFTTNATGNKVRVTDSRPPGKVLFYRAR